MLDTSQYSRLHQARTWLSIDEQQESWFLTNNYPADAGTRIQSLVSIEITLSELASYPGYKQAVMNLLRARTWDEYQEHWWMLKVAQHLAERDLLREMEVTLPSGSKPDIRAEAELDGRVVSFYVEAKSWRFHPPREIFSDDSDLSPNQRVKRTIEKLQRQLPGDSPGVWAWDKMRDGISGSYNGGSDGQVLGLEEIDVISEVCSAVPQVAAVITKALDPQMSVIFVTVSNPTSQWPVSTVQSLVSVLKGLAT